MATQKQVKVISHINYESESEVSQLCPTLCNLVGYSPPGSSIHRLFQARILHGLPFPSPGHLPDPGIKPRSPLLQVDPLPSEPQGSYINYSGHKKKYYIIHQLLHISYSRHKNSCQDVPNPRTSNILITQKR